MSDIQMGIVGLGPRGRAWVRLYQRVAGCKVVAICDRAKPLLEQGFKEAKDPDIQCFENFSQMLEKAKLDAVGVVTYPTTQVDLVCEALEAGKHVTSEVPAAYKIKDCWRLVLTVEKTGLKYQLAEQTRYWGFIQEWKQLVSEGKLGKIVYAEGEYISDDGKFVWWQDPESGEYFDVEKAKNNPRAQPTWRHRGHPIIYLPHELSPLLYVLEDRVTRVTAMCTCRQSYSYPELAQSDVQVALMHTENDVVMRLVCAFAFAKVGGRGQLGHHWYQLMGTKGAVETPRSNLDGHRLCFSESGKHGWKEMPWSMARTQAPPEAVGSGHGGADYYPAFTFLHAIRTDTTPPLDVYKSVETAAPAILSGESIDQGGVCLDVPDFRPGAHRVFGEPPSGRGD